MKSKIGNEKLVGQPTTLRCQGRHASVSVLAVKVWQCTGIPLMFEISLCWKCQPSEQIFFSWSLLLIFLFFTSSQWNGGFCLTCRIFLQILPQPGELSSSIGTLLPNPRVISKHYICVNMDHMLSSQTSSNTTIHPGSPSWLLCFLSSR